MKITFAEMFSDVPSPVLSLSSSPSPEEKKEPVREKTQSKGPDDETDFWEHAKCFDCLNWLQAHRFCTWNQGGYIISWQKCQGRGFRSMEYGTA